MLEKSNLVLMLSYLACKAPASVIVYPGREAIEEGGEDGKKDAVQKPVDPTAMTGFRGGPADALVSSAASAPRGVELAAW